MVINIVIYNGIQNLMPKGKLLTISIVGALASLGAYEFEYFAQNCFIFLVADSHGVFEGGELLLFLRKSSAHINYDLVIKPETYR